MHEDPDMHFGVPHNQFGEVVKGSFLVFGPGEPRPSEPGTRIGRGRLRSGGTQDRRIGGDARPVLMRVDQPCICGS